MHRGFTSLLIGTGFLVSPYAHSDGGALLQGVAANVAAAGSIGVAAAQASADKAIAKINAFASVETTKINADTSKYLQDNIQETAIGTSLISAAVALDQNAGVTQRLGMQLDALREARQDAYAMQRESMEKQADLKRQELDLLKWQSQALVSEYRLQGQKQLEILGLTGAGAASSGGGLTITRTKDIPASTAVASPSTDDSASSGDETARAAQSKLLRNAVEEKPARPKISARPAMATSVALGVQRSQVPKPISLPIAANSLEAATPHRSIASAPGRSTGSRHGKFD